MYRDWNDMYICQDMRTEPQWAEYEEVTEDDNEENEEDYEL